MIQSMSAAPQDHHTFLLTWVAPAFFEEDVFHYTVSVVPLNPLYFESSSNAVMEYTTEMTFITIAGLGELIWGS